MPFYLSCIKFLFLDYTIEYYSISTWCAYIKRRSSYTLSICKLWLVWQTNLQQSRQDILQKRIHCHKHNRRRWKEVRFIGLHLFHSRIIQFISFIKLRLNEKPHYPFWYFHIILSRAFFNYRLESTRILLKVFLLPFSIVTRNPTEL